MTEDDRRGLDALVNSLVGGTRDARKDRAHRLLAEPPSPFRPISSLHVGTTHPRAEPRLGMEAGMHSGHE